MKIDPKQIARMISEDPDEVNPLDNIEDEYESGVHPQARPCPECGNLITSEDDMVYCDAGRFGTRHDPYCRNTICHICLDVRKTGMSPSGWFIDVDMGERYCPDHAVKAQQGRFGDGPGLIKIH